MNDRLKVATDLAKVLAYLSLAGFLMGLTVVLYKLYPDVRAEILDAHRVTLSLGGTAAEIRASAAQWELASKQGQQLTTESLQVLKNLGSATANLESTSKSLNTLIENTDRSVNSVLIPQLSSTIGANDARLAEIVNDTDRTILALGGTSRNAAETMAEATRTLAEAGKVIADPAIPAILANTQTTAKNVAETTAHLNGASADIQEKVHQMTRPASLAKRIAESVFTLAAPVITIFK